MLVIVGADDMEVDMAKVGRNDPCPCGSGKKYKQCHGPIDAEHAAEQRVLRLVPDTLLPKIMDAAPQFSSEFSEALGRFWNGKYEVQDIDALDRLEERGAERFLTWFVFDYHGDGDHTPLERLAADSQDLALSPQEADALPGWAHVRLQPYRVNGIQKGQGFVVCPFRGQDEIFVDDHAAARRVEAGEALIAHLVPAAGSFFVSGAAAHLSEDTIDKLEDWIDLHLDDLRAAHPDAGYDDLLHDRSEIFNHFVMALPRELQSVSPLQSLIDNTRVLLAARRGGGSD